MKAGEKIRLQFAMSYKVVDHVECQVASRPGYLKINHRRFKIRVYHVARVAQYTSEDKSKL